MARDQIHPKLEHDVPDLHRCKIAAHPDPGAFILARDGKHHRLDLPRKQALRHVLLLGPSGSGKSKSFYLANCARATESSFLATDPKGELWEHTSGYHAHAMRYAPREPDASAPFNWVPLCTDAAVALRVGRALMGRTEAGRRGSAEADRMLCAAIFAHASTLADPTPASAYALLTCGDRDALFDRLTHSDSPTAREFASIVRLATRADQGRIALRVGARLAFLADPAVRRFTSAVREPVDFGRLRRAPTAAYWVLSETDAVTLRPLSALFFTLLLHQLKCEGENIPVTLLLDEFANLGDVPEFETDVTILRGRDVALVIGVQAIAQLEHVYGAANAKTIYENCQTTVALGGLSNDSAELVARTVTPDPAATPGDAPLLTADDVRRLRRDKLLVVAMNRPPVVLDKLEFDGPARAAKVAPLGPALHDTAQPRPRKRKGRVP